MNALKGCECCILTKLHKWMRYNRIICIRWIIISIPCLNLIRSDVDSNRWDGICDARTPFVTSRAVRECVHPDQLPPRQWCYAYMRLTCLPYDLCRGENAVNHTIHNTFYRLALVRVGWEQVANWNCMDFLLPKCSDGFFVVVTVGKNQRRSINLPFVYCWYYVRDCDEFRDRHDVCIRGILVLLDFLRRYIRAYINDGIHFRRTLIHSQCRRCMHEINIPVAFLMTNQIDLSSKRMSRLVCFNLRDTHRLYLLSRTVHRTVNSINKGIEHTDHHL